MNFGAFVSLPGGKSGLVHISEIANTFVKDVHDHLQVGQMVKVKVLDINEQGKINLSIKRVGDEVKQETEKKRIMPSAVVPAKPANQDYAEYSETGTVSGPSGDLSFEEKLKKFMQASDSKNADKRRNTERKQHTRRK